MTFLARRTLTNLTLFATILPSADVEKDKRLENKFFSSRVSGVNLDIPGCCFLINVHINKSNTVNNLIYNIHDFKVLPVIYKADY